VLGGLRCTADIGDGLSLVQQLFSGYELTDDLLGCVGVRFMMKSPTKSDRMRTLIHRGPIPRGHVRSSARIKAAREIVEMDTFKS